MLDQDPSLPTALLDFPAPPRHGRTQGAVGGEATADTTANTAAESAPVTAPTAATEVGKAADAEAPRQRWRFDRPTRWLVAHDPSQVAGLLDAAHSFAKHGQWCVGWVAYEAAPGLNPHLPVKALPPGQPYAVWAVFDTATPWHPDDDDLALPERWSAGPWQAELDTATAASRIEQIHELIRAGEVYQINLTTQLNGAYEGAPASLWPYFMALRRSQPQGYGLMLDARAACRAPGAVLSVSPELFFDWDGETLTTRPMKGTAARGIDAATDEAAMRHLLDSPKERAENLMIVDLLRNDLSRIAEVGSVQVPALFEVQALPTVWQMTSTVTAHSRPGLKLSEAFSALFPCGSVTGAPKRQAMHHIALMERGPRGVYCGAVGMMAPGGRVTLNVPIRTVCVNTPPPPAPWAAHCGIGSGITLDATVAGETAEWQAKQLFLARANAPFQLLESMRLAQGQVFRKEKHLQRLLRSAAHFAWHHDTSTLTQRFDEALAQAASQHPQGVFKLRLMMDPSGRIETQAIPLTGPGSGAALNGPTEEDAEAAIELALANRPMPTADDFVRHKTTRRDAYAGFAPTYGQFDTVLFNQHGELTETTIGNLALRLDGRWYTPPANAGLLPGVMRETLIADGVLTERTLTLDDLARMEGAAVFNSVRGWLSVRADTLKAAALSSPLSSPSASHNRLTAS